MESEKKPNYFEVLETLDALARRELETAFQPVSFPAHHAIYDQGAHSSAVYVVVTGVVEAVTTSPDGRRSRSIAFMGRGDFFGELGVLTGNARLATVRTCEAVKALQIDRLHFLKLVEKIPRLGAYLTRTLARRLYDTSMETHQNVYSVDLTGNLEHFDLLTIFQAVTSMGHSGELYLRDTGNNLIGSFFFREGRVEHARFAHLLGVEAVWQGFVVSATAGTFSFCVRLEPSLPYSDKHTILLQSTDLLMQGATRRDSFQALPRDLRHMEGRLSQVEANELQWNVPETQELAARIWELIAKRPQPLPTLWLRVNYSALTFLETVDQLLKSGQTVLLADSSKQAPLSSPPSS